MAAPHVHPIWIDLDGLWAWGVIEAVSLVAVAVLQLTGHHTLVQLGLVWCACVALIFVVGTIGTQGEVSGAGAPTTRHTVPRAIPHTAVPDDSAVLPEAAIGRELDAILTNCLARLDSFAADSEDEGLPESERDFADGGVTATRTALADMRRLRAHIHIYDRRRRRTP